MMKIIRTQVTKWCLFVACFSVGVVGLVWDAEACVGDDCCVATHLPDQGSLVPANASGLLKHGSTCSGDGIDHFGDNHRVLEEVVDGGENEAIAVAFSEREELRDAFELSIEKAMQPGKTYRYRADHICSVPDASDFDDTVDVPDYDDTVIEFETGANAVVPEELGVLEVENSHTRPIEVGRGSGCSIVVTAALAEIRLHLSEDARPWQDLFWYETRVNGDSWMPRKRIGQSIVGESWVGRAQDRIYARCDGERGLEEGTHTVQMRAHLAGVQEPIYSDEVEVDLYCGAFGGCFGCAAASPGTGQDELGLQNLVLMAILVCLGMGLIRRREADQR